MPRADPIVRARRVQLVDDDYPNEKRQRVAEYIDEHWNENDGMQLTDIAEECDVSRQHVKNTLEKHFEEVKTDSEAEVGSLDADSGKTIEMLFQAYRIGYQDGVSEKRKREVNKDLRNLLRD